MADDRFAFVQTVDQADWDIIDEFGRPLSDGWAPLRVTIVGENLTGMALEKGDLFYLANDVPVLSIRAAHALEALLKPHAELLPLHCRDADLVAVNVLTIIDGLDLERSIVDVFPSSNRLARIDVPMFRADRVRDIDIFRLARIHHSDLYVSKRFAAACESSQLRGLEFVEVWHE
jgi:hypothetical protein